MEQQGNDNNNNNTDQTQSMGPTDPTQIQPGQPSSDTVIPYGIPHYHALPAGEMTLDQMLNYYRQKHHKLHEFWAGQLQEVETLSDFRNHSLPLARIKKIMKADEDVRMISGEVPVLFARACEMFILELTLRGWDHTEENKRRTLQKNDISVAIAGTDIFDFLVDIVPRVDAGPVNRAASSSNPVPFVSGAYRDVCGYYYGPHVDIVPDGGVCMHHQHHHQHQDQQPVYVEQRPRAYVVARHLWEQLDQGEVLNEQEPQKPSNDS